MTLYRACSPIWLDIFGHFPPGGALFENFRKLVLRAQKRFLGSEKSFEKLRGEFVHFSAKLCHPARLAGPSGPIRGVVEID